ncbi:E3 ubiquitin-protein ligase synoviolin [Auxenochlorella protothecoides]|uniref:RING-type E3 ubiquitin transferase n=1 Tax=Auxenochlorella protothecoides TaxID=3075 RepID=A0A087SSK9_AUXPR|nr:E3 ubiquitin-protein ligase synoviolin [Auxenochlorella protothecoides]KFM28713.1 E3 ubiquitin-protein ligase synoviolin [Auxenochlorella protothecoides]
MALLSTGRYVGLSALLAGLVIWHGFSTREEFYPAVVHLSTSKVCIAVLGNLGFAATLLTYKCLTRIFLGQLRDAELERISERVSQAVVETCLAMTIFREDVSPLFMAMFVVVSFLKIFHWLVADRVDFIDTNPSVPMLTHFRLVSFNLLLLASVAADVCLLQYTLGRTMEQGISLHFLFAFESAVASSTCLVTFIKYCMSMTDVAMGGRWEGKGTATFFLELTLDLLHLIVYAAFFAVVFSTHGIPLYLIRDLYWTFRNFHQRMLDFLRYRRITTNMDARFPDATAEDLARADHTCIICREEMVVGGRTKRLPCGHVFHLHCLRSWLERQQTCPICRASPPLPVPCLLLPGPAPTSDETVLAAAAAATSLALASSQTPEGEGLAPELAAQVERLLELPGMACVLEGAALGLEATLRQQQLGLAELRRTLWEAGRRPGPPEFESALEALRDGGGPAQLAVRPPTHVSWPGPGAARGVAGCAPGAAPSAAEPERAAEAPLSAQRDADWQQERGSASDAEAAARMRRPTERRDAAMAAAHAARGDAAVHGDVTQQPSQATGGVQHARAEAGEVSEEVAELRRRRLARFRAEARAQDA